MKKEKVKVTQEVGNEVPTEVLAKSIVEISNSMKKLRSTKLNDKALLVLIQADCKESQSTIKSVMASIENLATTYLND